MLTESGVQNIKSLRTSTVKAGLANMKINDRLLSLSYVRKELPGWKAVLE